MKALLFLLNIGKLEALAVLLLKLKSEGRRVLILSQMILMLDILELFLNFHFLTFVRIDEYANHEQRQVSVCVNSCLLVPQHVLHRLLYATAAERNLHCFYLV